MPGGRPRPGPRGPIASFPYVASPGPDETVVVAFVEDESLARRDAVNAAVVVGMEDAADDGGVDAVRRRERMADGGFEVIVGFGG